MKLRSGKLFVPTSSAGRATFERSPAGDERLNFERIFSSDDLENGDVDTLDDGLWLDNPIDLEHLAKSQKRPSKRLLGRYSNVMF